MKKVLTAAAGTASVLMLTACGPTSGVITELEHEEAYTDSGIECLPKSGGGVQCLPYSDYYPETWCVYFEDYDGSEGSDCISEEEFANLKVGDFYDKESA